MARPAPTPAPARRRGGAVAYGILALPALLGFAALFVDYGRVQMAKGDLQQAADAIARHAAGGLPSSVVNVQYRGWVASRGLRVDGRAVAYDPVADLEFGTWDARARAFTALDGDRRAAATAVRVTVQRSAARGGPVETHFGKLVGMGSVALRASAIVACGRPAPITVEADACPWLAGMPAAAQVDPYDDNPRPTRAGDSAPARVANVPIVAGELMAFSEIGGTTSYSDGGTFDADGEAGRVVAQRATNGINLTRAPLNAFVGIFLDDRAPDAWAPAAAGDFSTAASRDFEVLQPPLKQVFFIGDGLDASGRLQKFAVPPGATRLYLGFMDEKGWWWDNTGSITLTGMDDRLTTVR